MFLSECHQLESRRLYFGDTQNKNPPQTHESEWEEALSENHKSTEQKNPLFVYSIRFLAIRHMKDEYE